MIKIDLNSSVPIYAQIFDQIKRNIALGILKTGDKLPSVREMSASLLINPNTIVKIYTELERESIIYTKKGVGSFVSEQTLKLIAPRRKKIICEMIEKAFIESVHLGMTADDFEKISKDKINELVSDKNKR